MENLLEEHEDALLYEELLVQDPPVAPALLFCVSALSASSLSVCSPTGGWQSEAALLGWGLVLIGFSFPLIGGDCSDLHACKRTSSKGAPLLHSQMTYTGPLTGSKQDLFPGDSVSQD